MRYNFVGKVEAKEDKYLRENKGGSVTLNLQCVAAQNNRAFLEMFGMKRDTIQTFNTENEKIEIDWKDREDEDVVKQVANFRKYIITLNGKRHEYISEWDFIQFVVENIDEIRGKEFTITGQVQKNDYDGKITDRFKIQNMYEVTEEKKHQLRVSGEFFFSADGVDTADWKKERKVIFNGYTREYMDKDHPNCYVPKTIIFDCSKLDFDNESHIEILKLRLELMGLEYDEDEDKIKVALKKNTYYAQNVILNYVNGAETVEFDESQLTPTQLKMVKLGVKKAEDFRPAGQIFGERVQLYKLVDYDLRGTYQDGLVKLNEKAKEFEENIYSQIADESEDDLDELPFSKKMNPPEEKKVKKQEDDIDESNLFD